jgi:hypothetical protein
MDEHQRQSELREKGIILLPVLRVEPRSSGPWPNYNTGEICKSLKMEA